MAKTDVVNDLTGPEQSRESALISPVFKLSDQSKDYILSFDYLGEFSDYDFVGVYYSLDPGFTWEKLGLALDDLGEAWHQSLVYGDFFGNDTEGFFQVKTAKYPLYELIGSSVMFKISHFQLSGGQNADYNNDGFLFDNFPLSADDPVARFYSKEDTTFDFPIQEVQFFHASADATTYLWDFGDGNTSTDPNPIHIYTTDGSFDVGLAITFATGSSSLIRENYIIVISQKGSSDTSFLISGIHEPIITQSGSGPTVELTLSKGDSYNWY